MCVPPKSSRSAIIRSHFSEKCSSYHSQKVSVQNCVPNPISSTWSFLHESGWVGGRCGRWAVSCSNTRILVFSYSRLIAFIYTRRALRGTYGTRRRDVNFIFASQNAEGVRRRRKIMGARRNEKLFSNACVALESSLVTNFWLNGNHVKTTTKMAQLARQISFSGLFSRSTL